MTSSSTTVVPCPQRVTLELTNHCNLSCPFCPRQHMDYPLGFMDKQLFHRLVDELSTLGTSTLVPFFRGEPLLHRDCLALLDYAKTKGFIIQLATNGLLLTEEIGHAFVAMGIDFVSFSVDTTHPVTYKERRRGGSFAKMLQGVDHLRQAREKAGASLPRIQASAVDTGMAPEEKEEFITFWQQRVDQIRIYPQHSKDGRFGSLDSQQEHPRQPCLKPFKETIIYWDGRIAICNHDWNRTDGPQIGKTTMQEVWASQWYNAIRQQQLLLDFLPQEPCGLCGHWPQYCSNPVRIGSMA